MLRLSLQKTTLLPPPKSLDDSNEADKRQTIFFFLKKKGQNAQFSFPPSLYMKCKDHFFCFFFTIVPLMFSVRAAAAPYCSCCKEWLLGLIVRLVLCDSILRKLSVCGLGQKWWCRTSSLTKVQGKWNLFSLCVCQSYVHVVKLGAEGVEGC